MSVQSAARGEGRRTYDSGSTCHRSGAFRGWVCCSVRVSLNGHVPGRWRRKKPWGHAIVEQTTTTIGQNVMQRAGPSPVAAS